MAVAWRSYMKGLVKLEITGTSAERFFNLCSFHQISMWDLQKRGDHFECCMHLEQFRKIRPYVRKTHVKIRIIERRGVPFRIAHEQKRQAFWAGFCLCVGILFFASSYVWEIHFEGNVSQSELALKQLLRSNAVCTCMPKSKVDCEAVTEKIRETFPQIVWASTSFEGSRLCVNVKENEGILKKEDQEEAEPAKDLVAKEPAVITQIITRKGTPLVHIGDVVKAGDLLVTGRIDLKNDAKEVVGYEYKRADADVYGKTTIPYRERIPRKASENETKKELEQRLHKKVKTFLQELEEKGIQICANDVRIHMYENFAIAEGQISVIREISAEEDTEILEVERN